MSELLSFVLSQETLFRRARLSSLYSDFTQQRVANPDGFAANVSAWIQVLGKAARAGLLPTDGTLQPNVLTMTLGEPLLLSLETKEWGRPLALGTVINEAVSQRQMIPVEEFLSNTFSQSSTWPPRNGSLLSWGMKQIGLSGLIPAFQPKLVGRFVFRSNVEDASNKILAYTVRRDNLVDRIFSIESFHRVVTRALGLEFELTEDDFEILLVSLRRDRQAIIYNHEIVRLQKSGETAKTVSAADHTIASLKTLIEQINSQLASLKTRIQIAQDAVQDALIKRNRPSALVALKSRKRYENIMVQRMETLAQLEDMYGKIEQAADQVSIMKVMEGSTKVLGDMNAEIGGVARAEDVLANLQEEMSKVDEIQGLIDEAGRDHANVDEEIDDELDELMRRENTNIEIEDTKRVAEKLSEAPSLDAARKEISEAGGASMSDVDITSLERLTLEATATKASDTSKLQMSPADRLAIT